MTTPHEAGEVDALECDNCARPDHDLASVRRVYVDSTHLSEAVSGHETVVDAVERWCTSCCTLYLHRTTG